MTALGFLILLVPIVFAALLAKLVRDARVVQVRQEAERVVKRLQSALTPRVHEPAALAAAFRPLGTPLSSLLALHRERLSAVLVASPSTTVVVTRTLDDVEKAWLRLSSLAFEERRARGWISREEIGYWTSEASIDL